jgi:hypothetical protein
MMRAAKVNINCLKNVFDLRKKSIKKALLRLLEGFFANFLKN